jgi:hypothetical protein
VGYLSSLREGVTRRKRGEVLDGEKASIKAHTKSGEAAEEYIE